MKTVLHYLLPNLVSMQSVVEAELSTGLVHPCSPICPICSVSAADSAEDDPLKKGGQTMCFINLKVLALMCLAYVLCEHFSKGSAPTTLLLLSY